MFTSQFKALLGAILLLVILTGIVGVQVEQHKALVSTRQLVNRLLITPTVTPTALPTASPSAALTPVRKLFVPSSASVTVAPSKTTR